MLGLEVDDLRSGGLQEAADLGQLRQLDVDIEDVEPQLGCGEKNDVLVKAK